MLNAIIFGLIIGAGLTAIIGSVDMIRQFMKKNETDI